MEVGCAPVASERLYVVAVKVYHRDPDLQTDVRRTVGFRAESSEGWRGPTRVVRQDAVRDVIERRNDLASRTSESEAAHPTGRAEAS